MDEDAFGRAADDVQRAPRTTTQNAERLWERQHRTKLVEIPRVDRASSAENERDEENQRFSDIHALGEQIATVYARNAARVFAFSRWHHDVRYDFIAHFLMLRY